jgi:hypothetical protein
VFTVRAAAMQALRAGTFVFQVDTAIWLGSIVYFMERKNVFGESAAERDEAAACAAYRT